MTRCLGCGSEGAPRFTVRGYAIRRCDACDLEFVAEIPDDATLAAVYAQGYFEGNGLGYDDYFGAQRREADAKARARTSLLEAHGARAGGRWLDLGCADGRFVREALARGHDAYGVELSAQARARADDAVRPRIVDALEKLSGPFDVVTAWDVLEHLRDPAAALGALRARTEAGALIAAVTPVTDNVTARRWPSAWDQYKPPEHLWYFSRRSLRALLCDTLGAECVYEGVAWRRGARVFDGAAWLAARRSGLARVLRRIEASLWTAAARARLVDGEFATDSALVVVRRRA